MNRATVTTVVCGVLAGCQPSELEWTEAEGFRAAALSVPSRGSPGFTTLEGSATGLRYRNAVTESLIVDNQHVLNGSGVAAGDIDGDGWVDVFFPKLHGPNQLYRNVGGLKFEDISAQAGVQLRALQSTGAVFADFDNDDDLDLLVTTFGPNVLFTNDGTGAFTESVLDSTTLGSTTATVADVDNDGDLDAYVANYKLRTVRDVLSPAERAFNNVVEERDDGTFVVRPEFEEFYDLEVQRDRVMRLERGEPDQLFLNDGSGNLAPVTDFAARFDLQGERRPTLYDWGLAARFYDVDLDGDQDLYVCNDFESPDRFWINDGTGRFTPADALAQRKSSQSSMAVDFSDIDRDGDVDFFVADMLSRDSVHRRTQNPLPAPEQRRVGVFDDRPQEQRNTLFLNRGDFTFAETARHARVDASGWSWASQFIDVDLDGYEDLIIGTGYGHDAMDFDTQQRLSRGGLPDWRREVMEFPPLPQRNVAFRNRGDGTFESVAAEWGVDTRDITHGIAAADFDNDGDLDLVLSRQDGETLLLRNESARGRVHVRLKGSTSNRRGIGARVQVEAAGVPVQSGQVTAGGLYLSHSDDALVFATGDADSVQLTVYWPSGTVTALTVPANHAVEIDEADSAPAGEGRAPPAVAFQDVSDRLDAVHADRLYQDELRQPLIPFSLSQLGPGVTWADMNGDGWDDLVLPSGAGGRMRWFRNNRGTFSGQAVGTVTDLDQAAALPWTAGSVLVTTMNYEAVRPGLADSVAPLVQATVAGGTVRPVLPGARATAGPLALADVDGDGDLDAFVGRRTVPAAYPMPAGSELYVNNGGTLVRDAENDAVLESIQRASDAVFSDLDRDGDPDLIVATDLGAVRIYRNHQGRFADVTRQMGMETHRGRWNGVAVADLNEDNQPDIIATNWGTNTWYQITDDDPLVVQYGDFDNNGSFDIIESMTMNPGWYEPVAEFDRIAQAVPGMLRRVSSVREFAGLSTQELLGAAAQRLQQVEVNRLEHTVFLNEGNTFTARALPAEAQLAPGFGVVVADANGDGHQDVFIAQNLFGTPPVLGRLDAGRGLWMLGDGTGNLTPWTDSGVEVYGEQRGAAAADFDRDGRVDLAVTQNGAAVKLFRNVQAAQGVRVRLRGPSGNPFGVGARVQLVTPQGAGPAYEITAGGGYWSMNSPAPVLGGRTGGPDSVRVVWPDGTTTTRAVAGSTQVEVVFPGR